MKQLPVIGLDGGRHHWRVCVGVRVDVVRAAVTTSSCWPRYKTLLLRFHLQRCNNLGCGLFSSTSGSFLADQSTGQRQLKQREKLVALHLRGHLGRVREVLELNLRGAVQIARGLERIKLEDLIHSVAAAAIHWVSTFGGCYFFLKCVIEGGVIQAAKDVRFWVCFHY